MLRLRKATIGIAVLAALSLAGCSSTVGADASDAGANSPSTSQTGASTKLTQVAHMTGGVSGGTHITVRGTGLAAVKSARISGVTVTPTSRTATSFTVVTPAAANFATGSAPMQLRNSVGGVLYTGTFHYTVISGLDRQMHYLLTYWKHYNPAYQAIPDDDCVDFTSQSLLARGWKPQGDWTPDATNIADSGLAWRSSTALHDFLIDHPELATPLTDKQRSKVKIGDIVQFDWDNSGDRDHTGVVTRVTHTSTGIEIYFAGHTNDSAYRSVDTAIHKDHPGGTAYYWSVKS